MPRIIHRQQQAFFIATVAPLGRSVIAGDKRRVASATNLTPTRRRFAYSHTELHGALQLTCLFLSLSLSAKCMASELWPLCDVTNDFTVTSETSSASLRDGVIRLPARRVDTAAAAAVARRAALLVTVANRSRTRELST